MTDLPDDAMLSKFRGAMLGVAIGDALGAPYEGCFSISPEELTGLVDDPPELRYTDDTHMTVGVAQSLVACRGFDGPHMARLFAENYEQEPWRGYGAGPPRIFRQILDGACWDEPARTLFGGSGSFGNGAAMRVTPVALFAGSDINRVAELARQTARITHTHELGVEGAVLQACGVALLLEMNPNLPFETSALIERLEQSIRVSAYREALQRVKRLCLDAGPSEIAGELGNDITALAAVPAALSCFLRHPNSFRDAVLCAIALGGDTDTIASMTGALSGAYLGDAGVPVAWAECVEGRPQLLQWADALHDYVMQREESKRAPQTRIP